MPKRNFIATVFFFCYHPHCIKSWEFHANLLFRRKGKVDGCKTDVARKGNPNLPA